MISAQGSLELSRGSAPGLSSAINLVSSGKRNLFSLDRGCSRWKVRGKEH